MPKGREPRELGFGASVRRAFARALAVGTLACATTPGPSAYRCARRLVRCDSSSRRARASMGWIPDPHPPRGLFIRSARKPTLCTTTRWPASPGSSRLHDRRPAAPPGRRSASRKVRPRAIADPPRRTCRRSGGRPPGNSRCVGGSRTVGFTRRRATDLAPSRAHARPADLSGSLPRASITPSRDRRATPTPPAPPPPTYSPRCSSSGRPSRRRDRRHVRDPPRVLPDGRDVRRGRAPRPRGFGQAPPRALRLREAQGQAHARDLGLAPADALEVARDAPRAQRRIASRSASGRRPSSVPDVIRARGLTDGGALLVKDEAASRVRSRRAVW